jgi:hypothetical protein
MAGCLIISILNAALPRPSRSKGWGVSDTALFWSEATGRSWSFLWSLGATPFGPLSTSTTLSFAQRDAMVRNIALTALNASVSHVAALVDGFVKIGGHDVMIRSFLPHEQVRRGAKLDVWGDMERPLLA